LIGDEKRQDHHHRGGKERNYDADKQIKGRKRHILVDTLGLLLVLSSLQPGVQDRDGAKLLFQRLTGSCKKLRCIWVDGGYRRTLLEWVADRFRFTLRGILMCDKQKSFKLLPRRWVVNALSRGSTTIAGSVRITKYYRKPLKHSFTQLMLRRLAKATFQTVS